MTTKALDVEAKDQRLDIFQMFMDMVSERMDFFGTKCGCKGIRIHETILRLEVYHFSFGLVSQSIFTVYWKRNKPNLRRGASRHVETSKELGKISSTT